MSIEPNLRASAYPAHLGWRLLAILYDSLPMIPLVFVTSAALLFVHGGKPVKAGSWLSWLEILIYLSVIGSYAVVSWRRGGQTMGMRPWRLMVVDYQGKNAALGKLCLRYVIAILSGGSVLLWSLVDKEKRGLHDIISGTYFVRKNALPKTTSADTDITGAEKETR
jgi:uncharacterized RDD family membrane protein YckC